MKKSIIAQALFLVGAIPLLAQEAEWTSPFVGYSNTSTLTIDKVEFEKGKTVMHVTAAAPEGTSVKVSSDAYLSADGKQYAIKKVSRLGMDKEYAMPDSGRVHFAMQFEPLPADTRLLHFVEGEATGAWKLCNIRKDKDDLKTVIPEEWKDVSYSKDGELPFSSFSDDSTFVNINILNYTPEAGRSIRLESVMMDTGKGTGFKRFPIEEDGTAVLRLHPCFPLTAFISIDGASPFPILLIPGEDVSILMDMGAAQDDFAAVGFKGAFANTHYELNVKGARHLAAGYDNSTAHFDSLFSSKTPLSQTVSEEYGQRRNKIEFSDYSQTTRELLHLINGYLFLEHNYLLNNYVKGKTIGVQKEAFENPSATRNLAANDFVGASANVEKSIFAGERMTLCPQFITAYKFRWDESQFKGTDGVLNTYNKDVYKLAEAIGYSIDGRKSYGQVDDPELKAYQLAALRRWNQKAERMNNTPHVHFDKYGEVIDTEQLRQMILDEYKGQTVVFTAYDKSKPKNVLSLDKLGEMAMRCDSKKIVFVCIDCDYNQTDYENWYEFVSNRPGEHYTGEMAPYQSVIPYQNYSNACSYEIYSPEGTCILSTNEDEKILDFIGRYVK
jgi:hypothetical protein